MSGEFGDEFRGAQVGFPPPDNGNGRGQWKPDIAFAAGFALGVAVWLTQPDWEKGGLLALVALALIVFATIRHPSHWLLRLPVGLLAIGFFIWLIWPTLWVSFHQEHPQIAFQWPIITSPAPREPPKAPTIALSEPERFSKLQYSKILVRDNENPIKLDIHFENTGNLPAVGVIHSEFPQISERLLLDAEIDVQFAAMQALSKILERQGVDTEVQPGDPLWWTMARSYSAEEFKRVTDGPLFLYVMVRAQYKDRSLPKEKWRITEICQFIFKGNAPHLCSHHNRIYISD